MYFPPPALPGICLSGPKVEKLIGDSNVPGDQLESVLVDGGAERAQRERQLFVLSREFVQRRQQDFRVLYVTHPSLVLAHLLQTAQGDARQDRLEQLRRVTEAFKGNSRAVNRRRVLGIDPAPKIHRFRKSGLDRSHKASRQSALGFRRIQMPAHSLPEGSHEPVELSYPERLHSLFYPLDRAL